MAPFGSIGRIAVPTSGYKSGLQKPWIQPRQTLAKFAVDSFAVKAHNSIRKQKQRAMKQIQKLFLFALGAILLVANAHAGRWITRDPMEVQEHMERDPHPFLDLNPYTFVRNNPLSYFDPDGRNAVAYVDAQGRKWWWGPYDRTPSGYTFQLTPYNQEFLPPGMIWGQDQYGNVIPVPNDIMGLQPSLLGELLLPTGAGFLAKPSWLTGMKVPARTVCLYRAVSQKEMEDIAKYGFRPGLNSMLAKNFATTAEDAAWWGRQFYNLDGNPFFLVQADVRASGLRGAFTGPLDFRPAITIPYENLARFNSAVNRVAVMPSIPIR